MAEYYAALRSGDSWTGATLHTDPECVDGNPSPLPEFVAEHDSTDLCSECADTTAERDVAGMIELGVCPWCDDYEGDHVGQHAASAHPDEWDRYRAE